MENDDAHEETTERQRQRETPVTMMKIVGGKCCAHKESASFQLPWLRSSFNNSIYTMESSKYVHLGGAQANSSRQLKQTTKSEINIQWKQQ